MLNTVVLPVQPVKRVLPVLLDVLSTCTCHYLATNVSQTSKNPLCALIRTTATSALTDIPARSTHPRMTDVSTGMASTVILASTDPLTYVTTGLRKKSSQCSYVTRGVAYRTTLPVAMMTTAVEFLPAVPVA